MKHFSQSQLVSAVCTPSHRRGGAMGVDMQ